ncbi:MAG: sodium/proline symporter PutP [Bacteroidetes bacterium]|jgi:sodium/proline symporter|nr:sodium/proline symporter PutP [Bacteroidota bacterium]
MISNQPQILISFIIYFCLMLWIGWFFYRRTVLHTDYLLAGRNLNSWIVSLSAQASDMSGWLLMGLPGFAYLQGLNAFWIGFGLLVGTIFNWLLVARRLRVFTEIAGDSITLPSFFEKRTFDHSGQVRMISAIFILIFFTIYTASGFVAGAKLFTSIFNVSYLMALTISAVIIIGYTFLGGFYAVSYTDFIQGIIMFFAIIIVPIYVIQQTGGFGHFATDMITDHPNLFYLFKNNQGEKLSGIAIFSLMAWGLGYFGQPHILARFKAIRSPKKLRKSSVIAITWVTLSLAAAILVGITAFYAISDSLPDPEKAFIMLVDVVATPWLAGILLAAILAAIMSTADSQLLVSSSSVTEDFYKMLSKKKASPKKLTRISRFSVVAVALIAMAVASDPENRVLDIVAFAWGGFGAAFGPLVLASLYWKKLSKAGAIAGILAGGTTTILWKIASGGIFEVYEIVPGFVASALAIIIVSTIIKPKKEVSELFERYKSGLY